MRGSGLSTSLVLAFFVSTTVKAREVSGSPPRHHELRTEHGLHLPIYRQEVPSIRRRGLTGSIGLGDYLDVTYNVLVTVGGVSTPVVLDTGSSDLWVISDACAACPRSVQLYPQATFQSVGLEARLLYGDSQTGTHAFGLIGKDTVNLAGLTLQDQFFAAINDTNTSVEDTGNAGIFGLGFPVNSVIWTALFIDQRNPGVSKRSANDMALNRPVFPDVSKLIGHERTNFKRLPFPNITALRGGLMTNHDSRQASSSFVDAIFQSYARTGPLLSRLVATSDLTSPQFTVTLQRNTVDVGGNVGVLSIGELPRGIKNESITWVPIRRYDSSQGGLPPPPDSPSEEYPITWEIFIDDVYLDGERLPRSTLSPPATTLSALVDTGNSLIRGPADVVQTIRSTLGTRFPCSEPHTLAFQIGGKLFPIDPRDFANQEFSNTVASCSPNLVPTDPPAKGGYLYSWSLGDPFLKSVLSTFHYGNLTYPSHDPPRMGFLSTVPADADDQLKAAVEDAAKNGGNFPATSEAAPTGVPTGVVQTNSDGVPTVEPTNTPKSNAAFRPVIKGRTVWSSFVSAALLVYVSS
ncbi:Pepsin A [Hypsizygus marmoreus]|uniref:Pepsin A n=1 Tax=Hypsizygus marmoreus TaxID=39966 RepID=A0A369J7R7_HYPMA|nr:Pepsin A [Hypsizygus marmoreus]